MTTDDIWLLFEKFNEIDKDGSGTVNVFEFCSVLQVEVSEFVVRLFDLLDQNSSGELDFVEFCIGIWNVCSFDDESALRFAFSIYDYDDDGYIRQHELDDLIKGVHGENFSKRTADHIKHYLKQFDTDFDKKYSFDEFKQAKAHFPSLFAPAYVLQMRMQEEIYGIGFWTRTIQLRKRHKETQTMLGIQSIVAATKASISGSGSSGANKNAPQPTAREAQLRLSAMNVRGTRQGSGQDGAKASKLKFVYKGTELKGEHDRYIHPVQEAAKADLSKVERFSITSRIRAGWPPLNLTSES